MCKCTPVYIPNSDPHLVFPLRNMVMVLCSSYLLRRRDSPCIPFVGSASESVRTYTQDLDFLRANNSGTRKGIQGRPRKTSVYFTSIILSKGTLPLDPHGLKGRKKRLVNSLFSSDPFIFCKVSTST